MMYGGNVAISDFIIALSLKLVCVYDASMHLKASVLNEDA